MGGRHGVPDLPVPVPDGAGELVSVGEALAPGQLPHWEDPVLLRVQHLALLAQGLGVGDGGLDVSVPRSPASLWRVVTRGQSSSCQPLHDPMTNTLTSMVRALTSKTYFSH